MRVHVNVCCLKTDTKVDTSTVQRVDAPTRDVYVERTNDGDRCVRCRLEEAPTPHLAAASTPIIVRRSRPPRCLACAAPPPRVFAGFGRPSSEYCDCFLDAEQLPEGILKVSLLFLLLPWQRAQAARLLASTAACLPACTNQPAPTPTRLHTTPNHATGRRPGCIRHTRPGSPPDARRDAACRAARQGWRRQADG
jgi:hypothetical protein